mmetsp:Transcript_4739/g.11125  ORF Transcript_4739/g.11125 Transcript_4739/m.11125 type:complete len:246 (+) Transcript_4739:921-1658(+)
MAPALGGSDVAREQKGHHRVGVVVVRVGEEEHFFAGEAELLKHRKQVRVLHNVPGRVLRDAVLDDAVPVAQVDALAQVHEELLVRLARDEVRRRQLRLRGRANPRRVRPLDCVLVLEVDQLLEELGVDDLELGVHVDVLPARVRRLGLHRVPVHRPPLPRPQAPRPVLRHAHVLVAIHFEDVAELDVEYEAAREAVRLVAHRDDLPRVAHRGQLGGRAVVRQQVELGLVLRERVVHIKANRLGAV